MGECGRVLSMKIAPYWVRDVREIGGRAYKLRAVSFHSAQEAQVRLEAKAHALEEFHRRGGRTEDVEQLRRKLREAEAQAEGAYEVVVAEPIVRRVDAHNIITRNRYGAQVLNSDDTCFLDVDSFAPSIWERLRGLFAGRLSDEDRLLRELRLLCATDPSLGVRVYRTGRGWRLLVAGDGLSPDSPRMSELCRRLRVDAMYAALCRKQLCWRARLTPKPSRLRMRPCPRTVSSEDTPEAMAEWLEQYARASDAVCVCRLVDTLGAGISTPISALHDEATGARKADRPLC